MAQTRNFIATEFRGKRSGTDFDDLQVIQDRANAAISRMDIRHGDCLDAITVYYVGQTNFKKRGGNGGGGSQLHLELGEYITRIEGVEHPDHPSVGQFKLFSNKGKKWGPYGIRAGSQKFSWNAEPNMGLLYFKGSSGDVVGHLQATFATYPGGSAKTNRAVRYETQSASEASVQDLPVLSVFARNLTSPIVTLTIGEEAIDFHTNQDVLCRLPFFDAALNSGFKETAEKQITMPEDEPEIIAALIEFLAVGKYTYTYLARAGAAGAANTTPTAPCDLIEGVFHLRVYATAFKYDCQALVSAAMESLIDVLGQLDGLDIIELLKQTYLEGCDMDMLGKGGDMDAVKKKLPGIIKVVYGTHGHAMKGIVCECPALANDLLRLSVSR